MKKLFVLLLAVGSLTLANAQGDWFDPSQKWTFHLYQGWAGPGIEFIQPGGDTLIGGQVWHKMDIKKVFKSGNTAQYERLIRQDGEKIFSANLFGAPFLMYDFELAVGAKVDLPSNGSPNSGFGYEVNEVGEIEVNGKMLKKQVVTWMYPGSAFGATVGTFIEGFGSVNGMRFVSGVWALSDSYLFLDEPANSVADGPDRTFCELTADWGAFEGLGNPLCQTSGAAEPDILDSAVFPNPSNGVLTIQLAGAATGAEIMLTDLSGRLLLSENVPNRATVETAFKGTAILFIKTEKGRAQWLVQFFE